MNRNTFSLGSTGSATVFFYDAVTNLAVPGAIPRRLRHHRYHNAEPSATRRSPFRGLPERRDRHSGYVRQQTGRPAVLLYNRLADDLTGPVLTGTSPEGGDSAVPLNGPVVVQFDSPMDPITLQNGFSMTITEGDGVSTYLTTRPHFHARGCIDCHHGVHRELRRADDRHGWQRAHQSPAV